MKTRMVSFLGTEWLQVCQLFTLMILWLTRSCGKLLLIIKICSVVFNSLWPHGLYSPWNSLGQNTGVGSLSLLQGIFPTQGLNSGFPHCSWILYQLSHKGSSRILEWVAYPFSRGSSWPRNWTGVSCITDRCFTIWAIKEACWLSLALEMIEIQNVKHSFFRTNITPS